MSDLMHPKVKTFTQSIGRELGVEESFIHFIMNESKPLCFEYRVEDPSRGWTSYVPDEVNEAYPLWSCNADQTLLCVGKEGYWFADACHDDTQIYFIAKTSQGVLAELFISLFESEESLIALKEGARSSGFRYLDRVIEFCESESDEYYKNKNKFINQIDESATTPMGIEEQAQIEEYLTVDPEELNKRQIPEDIVERLKSENLIILETYPLSDALYPCGIRIAKPMSAGGNVLPFENRVFDGVRCDAPLITLYWKDEKWIIQINRVLSGENQEASYSSPADAAMKIIDFYFGDPEIMKQLHKEPYGSPEEVKAEAVSIARKILNNEMMTAEGVENLAKLSKFPIDNGELIDEFHVLRGKFIRFPLGETRKVWNGEVLAKLDSEREEVEKQFHAEINSACQNLIRSYDAK